MVGGFCDLTAQFIAFNIAALIFTQSTAEKCQNLSVSTDHLYLGPRVERILNNAPCPVIVFSTYGRHEHLE